MSRLPREELLERIKAFEYWHYPFDLGDDVVITPTKERYAAKKVHLRDFIWPVVLDRFGGSLKGRRVLDVGCNAGWWSLTAHQSGAAQVLAIEGRPQFVEQATLVRDSLGIDPQQLEFRRMDLFDLSPAEVGQFDLILMLRVLHHLADPLAGLARLRDLCRGTIVLDVKVVPRDEPLLYLAMQEGPGHLGGVDAGLRLRPTRSAVELLLAASGFIDVEFIVPSPPLEDEYFKGKRALFVAEVSP